MTLSEKIIVPIHNVKFDSLPPQVIEKAKLCVLHSLSCAYAGIGERWSVAARDMTQAFSPSGNASVWFSSQKTNMADAAFTNAVYAQSILYEDIHRDSNAHPGIIIIPVAFAVSEAIGSSTKETLTAIVAGYEAMAQVGRGTACPEFGARGFRPTSVIGVFGSCVTAGHLLGLTLDQQLTAFSIAASLASGINQWAIEGSDDLYIQNGNAARGGIVAAQLAKRGVTAPKYILEGKSGVCTAFGFSKENLQQMRSPADHWGILDVLYKPAPACALVQTTAQAALDAASTGIDSEDILSGTIYTFLLGKNYAGCDYSGPFDTPLQARMSNQFNFAASLIKKEISNRNYYDFKDKAVEQLAKKMCVAEDPDYTRAFPEKQPVRVELIMKTGERCIFYKEEPIYLEKEDIIAKLHDHCQHSFTNRQISDIVDAVLNLERLPHVSDLLRRFEHHNADL